MEPRIQYAQTKDGVSIAFATMGEGEPYILLPAIPAGAIGLLQAPEFRELNERTAQKRGFVRYDPRGCGLSERDVADCSLDGFVLDLEAIVDRLEQERADLVASGLAGQVAIVYATRHPERVSHLILWEAYARASDQEQAPETLGLRGLVDKDWHLFTETLAHTLAGWSGGGGPRRVAAFFRECTTQKALQAVDEASLEFDVTALLPQVQPPTLVLHSRQIRWMTEDISRGLASRIPDARLTVVEGVSMWGRDSQPVLAAIDEFLGEGEEAPAGAAPSGLVTILFTDVEGSTALTQRLGDAKAREVLREHERIVREALKAHGGSETKTMGDGFMTSFSSATRALECAIAMQRAFAQHNESAEEPILVRVGLNAGEPIAEDEDLYGTAVIMAARIAAKAAGGEILTSDTVRGLVAGKRFVFSDRGEVALRGFDEPVRLYEVRWREEGAAN